MVSPDTPPRSADEEPEFPPERQRSRRPAVITGSVPVLTSIRDIRLPQDSTNSSPVGQLGGGVSRPVVDSGLIMKVKPGTVEMARMLRTDDVLARTAPERGASAGCSTHLKTVKVCTKWRFELKCCDSDSGPWASCEQRADLMLLHNPERSPDWLHKPVKGSGPGWELSSAQ